MTSEIKGDLKENNMTNMINKIDKLITEKNFSGVITIMKGEKEVYNKANGYANRPLEINNELDTTFGIASGTKLFTALGILKLVEEGKIKLDDLAFDYIDKDFPTYSSSVTIKQLLSHTSGIPDYYDEDLIEDFDNFTVSVPWCLLKKPSDYLEVMPEREMKFVPGSDFHYNNGAYIFLAMIIEKIAGDYHKYITDEVLLKHGLNNSGFYHFDQIPKGVANGYIDLDDGNYKTNIYSLPIVGGGDGGIFSSSKDIITLWTELMNGKVIKEELVKEMIYPITNNDDNRYGLGVWLNKGKTDDTYTPYIVGSDAGISFVSLCTNGVICNIVSNTSEGAWDFYDLIEDITEELNK